LQRLPNRRRIFPRHLWLLRAESGLLLSEVRVVKDMGVNHFILVDAGFNDLMRPALYGSYHGISLFHRDGSLPGNQLRPTVVAGPLCESGDVFTQHDGGLVHPRPLPPAQVGDYLVFHDTGAYGASMSSNFNSRPLLPEVLVDGGEERLIRRRQTIQELLALEVNDRSREYSRHRSLAETACASEEICMTDLLSLGSFFERLRNRYHHFIYRLFTVICYDFYFRKSNFGEKRNIKF